MARYICPAPYCTVKLMSITQAIQHVQAQHTNHTGTLSFRCVCENCPASTTNLGMLISHLKTAHLNRSQPKGPTYSLSNSMSFACSLTGCTALVSDRLLEM